MITDMGLISDYGAKDSNSTGQISIILRLGSLPGTLHSHRYVCRHWNENQLKSRKRDGQWTTRRKDQPAACALVTELSLPLHVVWPPTHPYMQSCWILELSVQSRAYHCTTACTCVHDQGPFWSTSFSICTIIMVSRLVEWLCPKMRHEYWNMEWELHSAENWSEI